ncbi:hypothetical protein GH714_034914 [Hevea brasiliensis]|uniref:Uncharacterized protein n=1 Tax=Hevea brasiliensis TaxID=3981 RepID=A0A6A6MFQ3_HEVBR|nr:hypothetical protein GH714_034914 [Hevea brasiliensis]
MANTDLFDAYFKRADLDCDGQISGAEAVAFFQGSGLPKQVLAQVWMHADQRKAGFLGRQEFYNALKLVTVAQSKRELTPDIVKAALYGPASAKIPAPQINLAATPAPKAVTPAPQMAGTTSVAPQNFGIRPPQMPGNASTNQQYFSSQQSQIVRPSQAMPSNSVSHPQLVPASQAVPRGSTMAVPRPSNSNVSTDWAGGGLGVPTTQNQSREISPPPTQDGFGLTASGLMPSVQPRPQLTTGQTPSSIPKPQEAAVASNQSATKDSKVSGNGFASESLFGDVFAAIPAQPAQSSSSAASSMSTLPVSVGIVPSSAGSQPSIKPNTLETLQSTFSQQPVGGHSAGRQNQVVAAQSSAVTSSGLPVGAANSDSSQSQPPWPKMTQSGIQKYMKVFVQVDTDRDGKITGEQARNLFLSWRLPREVLKQVWDLSDQDNDSMLSLREFCTALYLMERYREGCPLPTTLPSSVMSDEILLSATSHLTASHGSGTWGPASGPRPPQVMMGPRPAPAAATRPPRPPVHHADEKQPPQQKRKVPVLEKHLVDQLSQEEQDSLNSKFQEAAQADKKVEELEKEIADSRQKIEFYRVKMQELILYKSRCDSRLNEVTERVAADKREVEAFAKKYEEKYKQSGDVASKLSIEEATFRDIQEKKMELYRAIVKMEQGGTADDAFKERAENIQSSLEELVKSVNERCKQYGLRAKPVSLVELPFGWQPGIQEGAADWDENWDKFEDEGFTFVKELTLDVQNVVAPPKQKSLVQKVTTPTNEDLSASPSKAVAKSEEAASLGEPILEKESTHDHSENGTARSLPDSPAGKSTKDGQSHEFQDSRFKEGSGADSSPHAKEILSDMGGTEISGDKSSDEPGWGTFDTHYDTESVWGFDSVSGKDLDHDKHSESSLFDSMPSTPAYNQGKSSFGFGDSVPSTPAYNHGKNSFGFADSVPGTPAYNFGNSPRKFNEGSEDQSFDSISRFDSFNMHDSGLFQSPRHSLGRFDSMNSTRDADLSYGFPSRFDSFRESRDSDQSHGFSRFDSFRDSDQSHGFSRFDSFRDSDNSHGFPSRFDSFRDSDNSHGFPSSFDSFRETRDSGHGQGFSRFDSFNANDSGFSQSSGNSVARFDSVRGSRETDNSRLSFDDSDPFGSTGPFKTSVESETPRKSSDNWKAF